MEDGTFMTGIEIAQSSTIPQQPESKLKAEEKVQMPPVIKGPAANKANRTASTAATGMAKSLQPSKNESFPHLQHSQTMTAKSGMRNSMTEASFKKPLFKKIATVRDYFEKTMSAGAADGDRLKDSAHRAANYWKTKKEEQDEKGFTHADAFNQKIIQKFDDLYQTKKGFGDTAAMESLAKRKHFYQEIDKQETKLQGQQKRFNQITYDIQQKEILLEKLRTQEEDLNRKLVDKEPMDIKPFALRKDKTRDELEWEERIEVEEYRNECLKHMKRLKKELLLNVKKKYLSLKENYDTYGDAIGYFNQDAEHEKILLVKNENFARDLRKKKARKDNILDPEFEDLLENEMSEFEERRNLREIFKHEKVIEEELRLHEEEEERRTLQAKENRFREEENKRLQKEAEHEKELNKIKRQYHEFQKVTHVSRKDQLIEYFEGLEQKSQVLQKEIGDVDEHIKERKEELKELRKVLKFKKFEETEVSKSRFPKDIRLDDLEGILRDKMNDANDRENNMKRLDKLSYEVCTVISRVLKQLQKTRTPMPVDKSNVVELLSICGLKLERMLTVVIKKKKTFFIESINTDGTIKEGPPSYMNIVSDDVYNKSRKRLERDRPLDIDEEVEDAELNGMREQIRPSKK